MEAAKWSRKKAGVSNQHTLKSNGSIHIIFKSNGGWAHTEWDADANRVDRGKIFGSLSEAKAYIEEWYI